MKQWSREARPNESSPALTKYLLMQFFLWTLPLVSTCVQKPIPESSAALEVRLQEAIEIYDSEGSSAALPLFERLEGEFDRLGDQTGEARVLGYIGNCYKHLGEYRIALDYLQRSLDLRKNLDNPIEEAKGLNLIGLVFWDLADYAKAREHFEPALEIAKQADDQVLEASVLNNLALLADEEGDYKRSRGLYENALELFHAQGDASGENVVLANIGGVHLLTGEYTVAAEYYGRALQISQREGWNPTESIDLGNLGHCYLGMGRIEDAMRTFDKALVLAQETGLMKEQADWHRGKGSLFLQTGRYAQAIQEYSAALEIYAEAGLRAEHLQALAEMGDLYMLLGDPSQAEHSLLKSKELAQEIGNPRGEARSLISLGDLRFRLGLKSDSINLYRKALTLAQSMGDRLTFAECLQRIAQVQQDQGNLNEAIAGTERALRELEETGAVYAISDAEHLLARLYRQTGRLDEALRLHSQLQSSDLLRQSPELAWSEALSRGLTQEAALRRTEALASYEFAIETIESVRSRLGRGGLEAGYLNDRSQPYLELTRLSLETDQIETAFLTSERLRARTYSDLVVEDFSLAGEGPQKRQLFELRERVRRLRSSIQHEQAFSPGGQRPQAVAYLLERLMSAEVEYRELLRKVGREDPTYEHILDVRVPSLAEIQARIPTDAALVEYLFGPEECYAFVLGRSGLKVLVLPIPGRELKTRVELFRDMAQQDNSVLWMKPGQKLHELLIRPIEDKGWLSRINRLLIVPHETLHYLPFSALGPDLEGRVLAERYLISMIPSGASLISSPRPDAERSLLAMAPDRSGLKFAKVEAEQVAAAFPSPKQLLLGPAASESAFKSRASEYRVLHFATHAVFNQWNPFLSALELEPGGNEDGNLTVLEVLSMDLRAELITLSGCETGISSGQFSDLPPGDDFMGLTRAFQFAGGEEVLATLWKVDDESTSEFMNQFYLERNRGDSTAALAAVQRNMIGQNGTCSHPRYWAPFVIFDSSQ